MHIGVPKEIHSGECRVALSPEVTEKLIRMGFQVSLESGAGILAQFSDEAYQEVGAHIVLEVKTLWREVDLIMKVRGPEVHPALGLHEVDLMREGGLLVSYIWPAQNKDLVDRLLAKKATVLAMDCVPRLSRAQKLDALSTMANIAGYRAVIEAAHVFGRFFTGQVTAAGKIPPAKVFVIGAGVAGLSAIGTAASLGARVKATDTRSEVRDQIKSMGGEFVETSYQEAGDGTGGYAKVMSEGFQKAQQALIFKHCMESDIVITTALIPGKAAPKLVTAAMVESMRPGSVIVDLAAEQGGNCELTQPGQLARVFNVSIVGYTDLPSRLPTQSSTLYANNLLRLVEELCPQKDGTLHFNLKDEVIRGTMVMDQGTLLWPPPPIAVSAPSKGATAAPPLVVEEHRISEISTVSQFGLEGLKFLIYLFVLWLVGQGTSEAFVGHLSVFILACFVGYRVVTNVTAALHTPLMSVTNAISSIIIVGALIQASSGNVWIKSLSWLAVLLTAINMGGGFWVTHRMLRMFQRLRK